MVSWVAVTGEVNVAVKQDELEPVMAGTDRNVEVNAGNLNMPDEATRGLATTIAGPELTFVKTMYIGAEMRASSEFSLAWL